MGSKTRDWFYHLMTGSPFRSIRHQELRFPLVYFNVSIVSGRSLKGHHPVSDFCTTFAHLAPSTEVQVESMSGAARRNGFHLKRREAPTRPASSWRLNLERPSKHFGPNPSVAPLF